MVVDKSVFWWIVVIVACSLGSGNAKVVGSSPTVEVRVGVTARGGTGTPGPALLIEDHGGPFLLGVCVCVRACLVK